MSEYFVFDAWAEQHLYSWYEAGHSPNDWGISELNDFGDWVRKNQLELPWNASWSSLVSMYESEKDHHGK